MRVNIYLLVTLSLLSACQFLEESVSGNGNLISEQRSVGTFSAIHTSGGIEVRYKHASTHSVVVDTDENLLPYINVSSDGETLSIRQKNNSSLNPTDGIVVFVTAPNINLIHLSGASHFYSESPIAGNSLDIELSGASGVDIKVEQNDLTIDMSGASSATLAGVATTLKIDGSGSSQINAYNLAVKECELDLSGASDAKINASDKLQVEASGASEVNYKGKPVVNANTSGASSVSGGN